jgi:2,3-bisphosphoglycerate-independent phosphoglycerate mutase
MDVGLPEAQMGNSEVGHTNIGAGRIVYQELTRITKAIEDGELQKNEALLSAMKDCLKKGTALHLMGLLSDGGVHSHIRHLFGLLDMAKALGLKKIYVHCFLDGRDTPPSSGKGYVEELEAKLSALGVGSIADCGGRYYGMDRDKRWDRVKKHYDTLLLGEGERCADAAAGIQASYDAGVTDEFVVPFVCDEPAVSKTATPSSSLTSVPTAPGRSPARSVTRILTDLSARRAARIFISSA